MKRTPHKFSGRTALICVLVILVACTAFFSNRNQQMREANVSDVALGTLVNVRLYGQIPQGALNSAANAALGRARELEDIFSVYSEDSEITYVNQNAAAGPVHVSDDFYAVLERSLHFAQLTDGAFDPTLGRLIQLWGIGTENARVPSESEISPFVGKKNYEHVILDEEEHTVYFENSDFSLDLGGIVKGYAADEIKKLLMEEYDIASGLINLGGNIMTIGSRPDGQPWTLGIADPQNPQDSSQTVASMAVTDKTFVTSGDYQRYFEDENGNRYHHILDGSTGYPADTHLSSVTIIGNTSMDADALSTACFVLGEEKGMALLESLDGFDGVFIGSDGHLSATEGVSGQLQMTETQSETQAEIQTETQEE